MKEDRISASDFCDANRATRCINLISILLGAGQQVSDLERASRRMENLGTFHRMTLEKIDDLKVVERSHLLRYGASPQGGFGWEVPGSVPYTVDEYASDVFSDIPPTLGEPRDLRAIPEMLRKLRSGLTEPVVLVVAFDTGLNKRLIVDGVHRATALVQLGRQEPEGLEGLLSGKFNVSLVEIRSPHARSLYPCDFLELGS